MVQPVWKVCAEFPLITFLPCKMNGWIDEEDWALRSIQATKKKERKENTKEKGKEEVEQKGVARKKKIRQGHEVIVIHTMMEKILKETLRKWEEGWGEGVESRGGGEGGLGSREREKEREREWETTVSLPLICLPVLCWCFVQLERARYWKIDVLLSVFVETVQHCLIAKTHIKNSVP